MTHIIDILRGSKSEKLLRLKHDNLSTYNIGGEYSKNQWMEIARQLIDNGMVSVNEYYQTLRLTAKAGPVLKGEEKFLGRLEEEKLLVSKTQKQNRNQYLFDMLRQLRKKIADERNLPPYVIFHDRTLEEMASEKPLTENHILKIFGVGERKYQAYGKAFLSCIQEFVKAQAG
jgi:ATP-dependent DNA helicase RecQ